MQTPSQEPLPWEGTINNTQDGIHGLVLQDIWDNTERIIAEVTSMELKDSEGLHWNRMYSIKCFLIYVSRKYREMNHYLKGLRLTPDSWIPYNDKEG